MKVIIILLGLLSFAQAMTLEQELPPNRLLTDREREQIKAAREGEFMTLEMDIIPNERDSELEEIKAEIKKQKAEIKKQKAEIKKEKSDIKKQDNEPNKITYKSNINDDAYKARKSCLMSEKTAAECDKLFPVVKKTFKTSYEVKNVEPEGQKEKEKSDKLKSLMDEEPSPLNSDPIDVDA